MQRSDDELYDMTREFLTGMPTLKLALVGETLDRSTEGRKQELKEASNILHRLADLIENGGASKDDIDVLCRVARRLLKDA